MYEVCGRQSLAWCGVALQRPSSYPSVAIQQTIDVASSHRRIPAPCILAVD